MTELDALKKWCPMKRNNSGGNLGMGDGNNTYCIASLCMMWRGHQERSISSHGHPVEHGFCGLAGKPEGLA